MAIAEGKLRLAADGCTVMGLVVEVGTSYLEDAGM
jgi:hypothetical protein